ncbi:phosphoribosylglycinamide formyltransferase 2 [Candidatus Daviesbacteria bacterium RIFCSPHIGHO2_01_FULL_40_24]|uniref:Phosphoribosylglycinamide formyltransferase 2 n=1 Tax=Candidatus Daviesbacteria bacterium GW2011_GWC2_40_12 TaxID=1618431 RepID=A0A0G0QPE3_9BACT|nr:MAG: Phosphoribosylglycinamide formyltransferase 2 [Candidatus Daviesbacteria bacterium GW2011_GWF2_38_7]KKR16338.1 MAG: Phosphoribosylglycinamide formyltransferase 2 [Candidatus Daviesbacteria bacterium GW2011_GWA2_39_33]KKR42289.1 MAG: Phosphoribosylglycinamide formyltransferase 2 [Candidatus Daviesbacteria bacterium GW2011_GWC2_40_12]OGE22028.1 MAG: phosphoribosylglycinamide formyltransferase 2 [Candidatus Daviesbacteria bacterium RIFCSPHIGHO2_01_FULL_40_24]OGE28693.1 MAG: phosphoribosylg
MKRQILYSPLSAKATKIMLLGAGELGKEVIIEAMRLGFFTIAVDRYEGAPGQQVAHRSYTGSLKDAAFLRSLIEKEKPDYIVPEIEAINLDMLFDLEKEGFNIIPNAKATYTAMQRERIRELIVKTGVPVSEYYYASSLKELKAACKKAGFPCWVKAIQDSSGAGSSKVKSPLDIEKAYERAQVHARGSAEKLIVEKNIDFDLEVTELVVRYFVNGSPRFAGEAGSLKTSFCHPVGQYQTRGGDYHSSWQLAEISETAEKKVYEIAKKVTDALGGPGVFGCELFVKGDMVWANECSARPHDTGMVTFASHQLGFSEAGLHVRAITGLPIPTVKRLGFDVVPILTPAASHVILAPSEGFDPGYNRLSEVMNEPGVSVLLFGKNEAHLNRRMGVVLATDPDVQKAKEKAEKAAHKIEMCTRQNPKWQKQDSLEKHIFQNKK